jgi:hypothetical protein
MAAWGCLRATPTNLGLPGVVPGAIAASGTLIEVSVGNVNRIRASISLSVLFLVLCLRYAADNLFHRVLAFHPRCHP